MLAFEFRNGRTLLDIKKIIYNWFNGRSNLLDLIFNSLNCDYFLWRLFLPSFFIYEMQIFVLFSHLFSSTILVDILG